MLKNACVTRCANGRLSVESFDTPASEIYRIVFDLQDEFKLSNITRPIIGLDCIILEGEIEGQRIGIGYDNWSGCYVMGLSDAADPIIERIAAYYARQGREPSLEPAEAPAAPHSTSLLHQIGENIRQVAEKRPLPGSSIPPAIRREVLWFKHLDQFKLRRPELEQKLLESQKNCRADPQRRRFRGPTLRALSGLIRTYPEFDRLLANLDAILDAIPRSSQEDITGYHHYFHFEDLEAVFRQSTTFAEVLDQLAQIPFGAHFI